MFGLMQEGQLTLDGILTRAARWHAKTEIVWSSNDGVIRRTTYADCCFRAKQVSNALLAAGIRLGDRVGTLGWNSVPHFEVWYGAVGIGAICHTLNPRLLLDQIAYLIQHAGDRMIFADWACLPILGSKLTTLNRVLIGGSVCPETIIREFRRHGVEVLHGWGMTEASPLATVSVPNREVAALSADDQIRYQLKQGRLLPGLDFKLTDEAGARLPHDGKTPGRLAIKGQTVAGAYFGHDPGSALDEEGFFDTGDIATIDDRGYMQITDSREGCDQCVRRPMTDTIPE